MKDVICLKLISGEELIGKWHETLDSSIVIKDIASVVMMPGASQGQVSLGLMPFLPYSAEKKLSINKDAVVAEFEPNVDMLNNYNRMFGAGIQIASAM